MCYDVYTSVPIKTNCHTVKFIVYLGSEWVIHKKEMYNYRLAVHAAASFSCD